MHLEEDEEEEEEVEDEQYIDIDTESEVYLTVKQQLSQLIYQVVLKQLVMNVLKIFLH